MNDIEALASCVDIGKTTVTIGDKKIEIRPVSLFECLRVLKRFPALKSALGLGSTSAASDTDLIGILVDDGPEAIGALLACAYGHPGSKEAEATIAALPDVVLLPLLQAAMDITMPDGLEAFFGRLAGLANAAGLQSQASA